ncbi:MAG: single-stranded DNA-binding protein [Bacteroidetes bacterium]|nr:MAG: single-stranded DNA-binding protein [Bacteroidota bacterium]
MSVNKVILIGNVGRDPEVRHLENQRVVANFSLATKEYYRDRSGNRQELTEWHNIEMWDDLARTAEKYVVKGKLLYLEGKIRTNSWTDKESGQERSNKIIRANVMTFLNTGGGSGESRSENKEGNPYQESQSDMNSDTDDLPF